MVVSARMLVVPPQKHDFTAAGQLTTSTLAARVSLIAPASK